MFKTNLAKLLILFAAFICLNSCCTKPEIIYQTESIVIPDNIVPTPLNMDAPLTENEYILIIDHIRKDIIYCEILRNAGKITEEEYQNKVDNYLWRIEEIHKAIDTLKKDSTL